MFRISGLLSLQRLSPGRRVQALTRILERLPDAMRDLEPLIEAALAAQHRVIELARSFKADRDFAAMHESRARTLDAELDAALGALGDAIDSLIRLLPDDDPEFGMALELNDRMFPNGVNAVTRLPYVEQHSTVGSMLGSVRRDDGAWVDNIDRLGLSRYVDRIAELNEAYGATLTKRDGLTYDALRTAISEAYEPFAEVIVRLLGHPSVPVGDVETRYGLVRPVLDQQAEASQYRRRRRTERSSDGAGGAEAPATEDELDDEAVDEAIA